MKFLIRLILAAVLTAAAAAQEGTVKLKIRSVLHDPMKPFVELYVPGVTGAMERLNLSMEGIGVSQVATATKGFLTFYTAATIDPAKPLEKVAATVAVPAGIKQAIVLILPAGPADKTQRFPYRLMLINDSAEAFPKGESRVVNMTALPLAFRAGEHAREIPAAKVINIPMVTKLNEMNQAQTMFYRKAETDWVLLAERPTQYTKDIRNIFLMYQMPNVEEPQIRTLLDTDGP